MRKELSLKDWQNYIFSFLTECFTNDGKGSKILRKRLDLCHQKAVQMLWKKKEDLKIIEEMEKQLEIHDGYFYQLKQGSHLLNEVIQNQKLVEKFLPMTPSVKVNNQIVYVSQTQLMGFSSLLGECGTDSDLGGDLPIVEYSSFRPLL